MRKLLNSICFAFLGLLAISSVVTPDDRGTTSSADPAVPSKPALKLENLLKAQLEGVEGIEVIVSRVTIPPDTSLPKHWHPGEEFAYILEGSAILWQDGEDDIVGRPGDVLKIPLKRVHTAITTEEGATVLVFRVHEQGQPERVPVE